MIIAEEAAYSLPITVEDGWEWNMKNHIKTSLFYKHGRLLTGNSDDKPIKNITKPILNVAYRAEDIDVKDIHIYVDNAELFHLSFLIKKYHDDVFARENDLDTFFDEVKEEKIDFGGSLIKRTNNVRPQKVPLQSIAFCDQTDILGGPLAIKHNLSPDKLKEMESMGWGEESNGATISIDELIDLSTTYKVVDRQKGQQNATPGNYIEIYEVRGVLPTEWLEDNQVPPAKNTYIKQVQIVAFYKDREGSRRGVTLFRGKDGDNLMFVSRDAIFGRALGSGGAEELFEPQVWTNYGMIRMKEMLDSASKTILKTTDSAVTKRQKVKDMDNLEVVVLEQGADLSQVDTYPRNFAIFDRWNESLQEYAQLAGSASDPVLGESSVSGTPFRAQERVVFEGKGIHEYRREKYATFIEKVYQEWIIPAITKELRKGTKFLSELSLDEMQYVADCFVRYATNKKIKEMILSGETVYPEIQEEIEKVIRADFMKGGNKRFTEIMKDDLKNAPLKVKVNVAGKQKDMVGLVDKLTNVFRQVFANPQLLDNPKMAKIFNKILEYSGLDPTDFDTGSYGDTQPQLPQQQTAQPAPVPVAQPQLQAVS